VKNDELTSHKPNLLISNTVCDKCYDHQASTKNGNCEICGEFIKKFFGFKCELFGDYVYKELAYLAEKNDALVYIFDHNFKSYDGHFILQDVFNRDFRGIEPIPNGSEVIKINDGNVRFIESLSFFLLPLPAMPKAFGLERLVEKGFCPFLLNNKEEIDYVGDLPDEKYFGTDIMKSNNLARFKNWHNSNQGMIFNLKHEMEKYRSNDVLILLLSVMEFRNQFKEITSLDPITRNFTLAPVGLEISRAKFFEPEQLAITPITGF